jgi:hypothetical protein
MPKEIKNMGASVRARLQALSRANGQSFDLVLTRLTLERLDGMRLSRTSPLTRGIWPT